MQLGGWWEEFSSAITDYDLCSVNAALESGAAKPCLYTMPSVSFDTSTQPSSATLYKLSVYFTGAPESQRKKLFNAKYKRKTKCF